MPNVIANFPRADYRELVRLLDGSMSPTRWLSLVAREWGSRPGAPLALAKRTRSGASVRVTGHMSDGPYREIAHRARRHNVAEAHIVFSIAVEALRRGSVPKDEMGLPDFALARQNMPAKVRASEIECERERRARSKRSRAREEAAAEREAPQIVRKLDNNGPRTPVNARISKRLYALVRAEANKNPKVSLAVAWSEAAILWLAERSLVRNKTPKGPSSPEAAPSDPAAPQTPSEAEYLGDVAARGEPHYEMNRPPEEDEDEAPTSGGLKIEFVGGGLADSAALDDGRQIDPESGRAQ